MGGHDIVVGGDGYFWWGFVTVDADKVTTIEVDHFEYGIFNYELHPGVEAELVYSLNKPTICFDCKHKLGGGIDTKIPEKTKGISMSAPGTLVYGILEAII